MTNWTGTTPTVAAGAKVRGADIATLAAIATAQTDAWTSYTPTLSGWTLNNGTMTAFYKQIGKEVWFRGQITWGSTTSASGDLNVALPVTGFRAPCAIGTAYANDTSAGVTYPGVAALFGSIAFFVAGTKNVSNTQPFTWASGDSFIWWIKYEIS
ncbi:MAG TPA: hypothetical protein VIR00_06175 [Micromonosporaceae bacterium]